MASSTTNHLGTQDYQQHISLEEIYHSLENVFADDDFTVFQEECERVASFLDKHSKPLYFPVKFDLAKHKISTTTAEDYLNLLPDEDPNADLKSLKPVEIINDGSVLFRAVASLLGFSSEENVRELRLRSLLDATLNSFSYGTEYRELQRILSNPNQTSMKNWSSLVHERSQNAQYLESQISPGKLDIARSSNRNCNSSSVARRRGTFILIFTTVSDSGTCPTGKRISDMKVTIIELMKTIATNANSGDIIEVNTCDEELTQPPLIPFCEASKVTSQENLHLIDIIQFREAAHPSLSICISAALDKLARQSIYYTDFFWVIDNLIKYTVKTSQGKSVLRVLRESRSISKQIITYSDKSVDPQERFESSGTLQVNYLHSNTNDIRHQINIIYKRNPSSRVIKRTEISAASTSKTEANPVPVRTTIHFLKAEGSTSGTSTEDQNNHVPSFTSDLSHQNSLIRQDADTSFQNSYRAPTFNRPLFRYCPWNFK